MSWLARLFRPRIELPAELDRRVRAWRNQISPDENVSLAQARFIVVDVETSGLDTRKDRLLSIGAVAVEAMRVRPGESFDSILRREEVSERENILIHGIGPQAQAGGIAPEQALLGFLEYAGKNPLVAFHAGFDRVVLDRALRQYLGERLPNVWLDLAYLAPALVPAARLPQAGLDEWLAYFGLRVHTRHRAVDDSLATGELFLVLLARARERGVISVGVLHALAEEQARRAQGGRM
jgi:DNA polymerase-3 subunit epsilon